LSIVQGPFSVAPCQTLALRFATCASLYQGGGAVRFLTPDKALVKLYRRIVKGENANRFFPDKDPAEEQARASAKLDLQAEVRKLAGRVVAMMGMIVFMIRD
jgi:hypothetical protein